LPQHPETGYEDMQPDVVLRSQMDTGPAKSRRRFTAGPRPMKFQIYLQGTEVDTFVTFMETTLVGGAKAFDWVHPRTGAAATYRLTKPYVLRHGAGPIHVATLELEILP
jgi:hypothetical protein